MCVCWNAFLEVEFRYTSIGFALEKVSNGGSLVLEILLSDVRMWLAMTHPERDHSSDSGLGTQRDTVCISYLGCLLDPASSKFSL